MGFTVQTYSDFGRKMRRETEVQSQTYRCPLNSGNAVSSSRDFPTRTCGILHAACPNHPTLSSKVPLLHREGGRESERDWNYDYGIQQLCYDRSGKDNGNADEGGKMGRARKGGLLLCYTLVG